MTVLATPKGYVTDVKRAHTAAIKEAADRAKASEEQKALSEKQSKIEKQASVFDPKFQSDVPLEKTSELAGKQMRTYAQACYDDGKYLFKSETFCNQKKGAHADQKWIATYDRIGTPVWLCMTCKSVYPRKEKQA